MRRYNRGVPTLTLLATLCTARANASGIPLQLAIEAAREAIAVCKSSGYDVTITILDSDLTSRLVLRGDGARDNTVQLAYRKAYTVVMTGMPSGEFGKIVAKPAPRLPGAQPAPVNGDANLITLAGGLPIKISDRLVGAMSASGAPGGEKDEACVKAGLDKIASRLQ